ncbi:hypothetical protein QS257_01175 [Terrilactibacillus sp. S3-3]|nr:hypothetical protein QS257_01175 [Terrilactibacillus sp. S3-3]
MSKQNHESLYVPATQKPNNHTSHVDEYAIVLFIILVVVVSLLILKLTKILFREIFPKNGRHYKNQ